MKSISFVNNMFLQTLPALVLVVLALVTASSGYLNFDYYCGKNLECNGNRRNTMCKAELKFSSNCRDAKYVPITDEYKQLFLDVHNKLRNEQALGKTGHIFTKTVADMASMLWDEELALMSLRNAMSCQMEHDSCRNTAAFKMAGQNLAIFGSKPNAKPIKEAIVEAIQLWYDEYKDVPHLQEVEKLGSSRAMKPIGHWTQLVQSKAHRIGCSVVQFTDQNGWKQVLIGCNYSAGNLVNYPIFRFGAPASKCKTGKHPKYPGLCSEKEDYSKHKNGNLYFDNKALDLLSPVIKQWLKNGKKIKF